MGKRVFDTFARLLWMHAVGGVSVRMKSFLFQDSVSAMYTAGLVSMVEMFYGTLARLVVNACYIYGVNECSHICIHADLEK